MSEPVSADHPDWSQLYAAGWSGDSDLLASCVAPDVVYVEGGMNIEYRGVGSLLSFMRYMFRFASDSAIEFTHVLRDPACRRFTAEWVWSGTADGPLEVAGKVLAPTGKAFAVAGIAICEVGPEGRISYHKDYYGVADLMSQVGLA